MFWNIIGKAEMTITGEHVVKVTELILAMKKSLNQGETVYLSSKDM